MHRSFALLALCFFAGCRETPAPATGEPRDQGGLTVAAAANLTNVFQLVGKRFEAQTHTLPTFSFASTAQLTQQIENSASFDVFAAADSEHVDELERKGLLVPGSKAVYARGVLALWIPAQSKAEIKTLQDLGLPTVRFIAVANPKLAPYGEATMETLEHLEILNRVRSKIVFAEDINMAREYGVSRNADAVFTAYSLVLNQPGRVIRVSEDLHSPINQELGILSGAKHLEPAWAFTRFLLKGSGRDILREHGYIVD